VAVTIPPEVIGIPGAVLPFSLVQLIHAVGLTWEQLVSVSFYGGPWQPAALWEATAAEFLRRPVAAANVQILLLAGQKVVAVPQTQPVSEPSTAEETSQPTAPGSGQFARLESEWRACQGMERQLAAMRKQLAAVLGRLGGLDRDLRPEENLVADRLDKDAWQDARRWIREAASKIHKCIKAHDLGITSAAGRRNIIQERYDQSAENASAVGDFGSCLHDVEVYRREMTNLHNSMGSALQAANTNGIQRAQRVLSRISAQASKKRARDRGR
jgi:hypothetical protein